MINDLIEKENVTMFMEYTVRNWTFDGIVEQLIEFGSQTDSWMELPIPFDKFGWFYPVRMNIELFRPISCFSYVLMISLE